MIDELYLVPVLFSEAQTLCHRTKYGVSGTVKHRHCDTDCEVLWHKLVQQAKRLAKQLVHNFVQLACLSFCTDEIWIVSSTVYRTKILLGLDLHEGLMWTVLDAQTVPKLP